MKVLSLVLFWAIQASFAAVTKRGPLQPALGAGVTPTIPNLIAPTAPVMKAGLPRVVLPALDILPTQELQRLPPEGSHEVAATMFGELGQTAKVSPATAQEASPRESSLSPASAAPERSPARVSLPASPPSASRPFFVRHHGLVHRALTPIVKFFYRLEVRGLENLPREPSVIIANHVSWMDGFLIYYVTGRPFRALAKRKYYDHPLIHRLCRALGFIPVAAKESMEKREQAFALARQALAGGDDILVFPEGTRTPDGSIGTFRRGFQWIAEASGAPVVPVHLDGLWGALSSHRKDQGLWARLRPRPVVIRFGKPLEDLEPEAAREAVIALSAFPRE